jgi:hypothetical protein
MTPTLFRCVLSLPPRLLTGAWSSVTFTLRHCVYSLPLEGAAGLLGSGPAEAWS